MEVFENNLENKLNESLYKKNIINYINFISNGLSQISLDIIFFFKIEITKNKYINIKLDKLQNTFEIIDNNNIETFYSLVDLVNKIISIHNKANKTSIEIKQNINLQKEQKDFFNWLDQIITSDDELEFSYEQDSILINWDMINNRINAEIASNIWGKDYGYHIRLDVDKPFQTALENLKIAEDLVK